MKKARTYAVWGGIVCVAALLVSFFYTPSPSPQVSSHFSSFTVLVDDQPLTLPFAFTALAENGWQKEPPSSLSLADSAEPVYFDTVVQPGEELWIALQKSKKSLSVCAHNYTKEPAPLRACTVVELYCFSESENTLTLARGITPQSSAKSVRRALEGTDYTEHENTDYLYFCLRYADDSYYKITFLTFFGLSPSSINVRNAQPMAQPKNE